MKRLVLGTAGHIDHGKTALVRALTGTDTDRLKEERERGITIELGFAALKLPGVRYGVVDVPGHEAFVKTMVAGAAGTDVVLLAVAADEGVMPQTREHVAIVQALGASRMVIALTKCDAADEESLEVVGLELDELLEGTLYEDAPRVRTSALAGTGLDELRGALEQAALQHVGETEADLLRLPVDRVFSVAGAGTVVTGTVWSGGLVKGDRVRVLPVGKVARIRGLQVHGRTSNAVGAGERAAVALVGDGSNRASTVRGSVLVADPGWGTSWILSARVREFPGSAWTLEHNQRVRVHLATSEVLARVALLPESSKGSGESGRVPARGSRVEPGESRWIQLRLEEPVVARARDRIVLRSYSPVTSIAGAVVAEPRARKRARLSVDDRRLLESIVDGSPRVAVEALLDSAGWLGVREDRLPVLTGLSPGSIILPDGATSAGNRIFSPSVTDAGAHRILERVDAQHRRDPLLPTVPAAVVRASLPRWAPREIAGAIIEKLCTAGLLEKRAGGWCRSGHTALPSREQEAALHELAQDFQGRGLSPVRPEDLRVPPDGARADNWPLVRHLEAVGTVTALGEGLFVDRAALDAAVREIQAGLGGRTGLGPADFRKYLKVSRKKMLPVLNHLDTIGVTVKRGNGRSVFKARNGQPR